MTKHQLRAQITALQFALDYAEKGGDPGPFSGSMVHPRDGGAWVPVDRERSDPKLQAEVGALLQALAEGREPETDVRLTFGLRRHGDFVVINRAGRQRDRFMYRLIRLLEEVGAERLRVCPECSKLFLKVSRKEFCSTKCQARVNMRNYRRQAAESDKKGAKRAKTSRTR